MSRPAPKILVLSLTRMGDIIQSIPFVRRLRRSHPEARVDLLVEEAFREVAELVPEVDEIVGVQLSDLLPCLANGGESNLSRALSAYRTSIERLSRERYTEVWNLTHTKPSTTLNFLLAKERGQGVTLDRSGLQLVNSSWLRYFYATNLARPWCQFNLVDIYANCVGGVEWDFGRSLTIDSGRWSDVGEECLPPFEKRLRIAIHPAASQKAKQWPLECFREVALTLAARHELQFVLLGHRRDASLSEAFAGIPHVVNLIGATSPRQLAAALSQCRLLLTNDSGPMHVAAAVGTKVVAITVGTALGSETAPYGAGHLVIEPEAHCFPCHPNEPCPAPTCARRIFPATIMTIMECELGFRREPPRERECAGCRVYRTTFSSDDRLLRLDNLFPRPVCLRDQLHDLVRPLWLALLEPARFSKPNAFDTVPDEIRWLASEALPIARQARSIAKQIARASASPHQANRIPELGRRLQECDVTLSRILSQHGLLASFLNFVWISKGSLQGHTLRDQAEENATIYQQLTFLLSCWVGASNQTGKSSPRDTNLLEALDENYS